MDVTLCTGVFSDAMRVKVIVVNCLGGEENECLCSNNDNDPVISSTL